MHLGGGGEETRSVRFVLQRVSSKLHITVHKENGICTIDCSRPKSLLGKTTEDERSQDAFWELGRRRGRAREVGMDSSSDACRTEGNVGRKVGAKGRDNKFVGTR